jgi:alpha-mannosidase
MGVEGEGLEVTAFRRMPAGGYELRAVETEGRACSARVGLRLPLKNAAAIDLLGNRIGPAALVDGRLAIAAAPWKILTYRLD